MKKKIYISEPQKKKSIDPKRISTSRDDKGNYIVSMQDTPGFVFEKGFHEENLAEKLDENILNTIASDLLECIQDDLDSRTPWMNIIKDGMTQLGLQKEQRTWPFEGANGTFSPALCQAWLSVSQTIIAELLLPKGPAKSDKLGAPSKEQDERAERIEDWYNIFFTRMNKSFYPDMEQAIMWAVNNGSAFIKNYIDPITYMPLSLHIRPDDFIVNTSATSLALATRITQRVTLTQKEMALRQSRGIYKSTDITPNSDEAFDTNILEEAIDQIQGIENINPSGDSTYVIYESHAELDLERYEEHLVGDPKKPVITKPYRITIDLQSSKILAIYRNWEKDDENFKRIECFVPLNFIPGYGIYGLGLFHLAANNASASTQIQRQLIDAGVLSNFPGGVRAKNMRFEENNIRAAPTEFVAVETGGMAIQDCIMPFPYKEPSPILKDLKDGLDKAVMDIAGAANTEISEIQSNMPVGTILSIIEASQKIQSAVMQRMHRSMGEIFEILYGLFTKVLPDEPYPFHLAGKSHVIMRSDFKKDIAVIPVSDPNLSSFAQRAATMDALKGLLQEFPEYFNKYNFLKRYCRIIKVSDIDELLIDADEVPPPPPPTDVITENQNILNGKPVKAYIFQNQDAYIATKLPFLQDQSLDPQVIEAFKANISERIAFKYQLEMQQKTGIQLPEDPSQMSPDQMNELAMAVAQISQEMMQQQQQEAPLTVEQVGMAEVQVKDKEVEVNAQVKMAQLEVERMKLEMQERQNQQKMAMDEMKMQIEEMKLKMEEQKNQLQAKTEAFKAQLKYHSEEDKINSKEYMEIPSI